MSSRQIHRSRTKERHKDVSKQLSPDANTLEDLSIRSLLQTMSGIQWKTYHTAARRWALQPWTAWRRKWGRGEQIHQRHQEGTLNLCPHSSSPTEPILWPTVMPLSIAFTEKNVESISLTPMKPSCLSAYLNIQACFTSLSHSGNVYHLV